MGSHCFDSLNRCGSPVLSWAPILNFGQKRPPNLRTWFVTNFKQIRAFRAHMSPQSLLVPGAEASGTPPLECAMRGQVVSTLGPHSPNLTLKSHLANGYLGACKNDQPCGAVAEESRILWVNLGVFDPCLSKKT